MKSLAAGPSPVRPQFIKRDVWTAIGLAGAFFVHAQPSAAQSAVKNGVDLIGQPWAITISWHVPQDRMPKTNDTKMASFDPATYLERACVDAWQNSHCDLYVQPDADGSLVGYLIIVQSNGGLWFKTDNIFCGIGGPLTGMDFDPVTKEFHDGLDPTGNWHARSPFEIKSAKGEFNNGILYLEKIGDKLRVTDERWNYCYPDRHLDDVYSLVGSLTRKLDPSRWPPPPK